jgi:hypothetical protein
MACLLPIFIQFVQIFLMVFAGVFVFSLYLVLLVMMPVSLSVSSL